MRASRCATLAMLGEAEAAMEEVRGYGLGEQDDGVKRR